MHSVPLTPLSTVADAIAFLRTHVSGTLCTDSRNIAVGDGFIAYPGDTTDGRAYIQNAIARGATACLVEHADIYDFWKESHPPFAVPVASLPHLQAATGEIAAQWFDYPSRSVQVLAVTGTNGKTSTTWWLAGALNALAPARCAVIGTLGIGVPPVVQSTGLTTPDALSLQRALRTLADDGVCYAALEASSIGLAQQRLAGTHIGIALWTNFSQDHLDWHGSMAAYWQAKRALFDWSGLHAAVVPVDDAYGANLVAQLQGRSGLDIWSTSITGAARLAARDVRHTRHGLSFTVLEGDSRHTLHTRLLGAYNVANLLGVLAALRILGTPLADAIAACAQLDGVPGRMQQVSAQDDVPLAIVDYAHTPDALRQALAALQPITRQRGGRLWCVFGCGGNRDASKRPLMGAIAQQHADVVVLTSDNPRNEAADAILAHIAAGMTTTSTVHIEPDRARAIAQALAEAAAQDVVLIAGKGHETQQEIAGQQLPFSDAAHARAGLVARLHAQ